MMKIVNIGPMRLLERVLIPNKVSTKKQNKNLVLQADEIVVHIDDEFFKEDKSIGTKVEIQNNWSKIVEVIYHKNGKLEHYYLPDEIDKQIGFVKDLDLPSWEDYVLDKIK